MFQPSGNASDINKKQNDEKGLHLNACFGIAYQSSKNIGYLNLFLAVIIPVLLSVSIEWFELMGWSLIPDVLSILLVPIVIALSRWEGNAQWYAADIHQLFECYIFDMPWEIRYFGEDQKLRERLAHRAKRKLKNAKYHKKRSNWYEEDRAEFISSSAAQAIFNCQKTNILWETNLRKRYGTYCIALVVLIVLTVVLIYGITMSNMKQMVNNLVLCLPIIVLVLEKYFRLRDDLDRVKMMDIIVKDADPEDGVSLLLLQRALLDHRRCNAQIPYFFYKAIQKFRFWQKDMA